MIKEFGFVLSDPQNSELQLEQAAKVLKKITVDPAVFMDEEVQKS